MGERAHSFLDESLSSAACSLGSSSRYIFVHAPSCARCHYVASSFPTEIGSKCYKRPPRPGRRRRPSRQALQKLEAHFPDAPETPLLTLAIQKPLVRGVVATWGRGPTFGPAWYPLALIALAMPCALAGGRLRGMQLRARA